MARLQSLSAMASGVPGEGEIASVPEGTWSNPGIPDGLNDEFLGMNRVTRRTITAGKLLCYSAAKGCLRGRH
jgi:hypothetical protein